MVHRFRAPLIVFGLLIALARPSVAAAVADEATGASGSATAEAPKKPPVDLGEELPVQRPADLSYGVAVRAVWVSVPQWLLHPFASQNVPLSSWGTGIQVFRRKGNFDIALSFNYQNMSPPPGNWLGNGNKPLTDTSYLVFNSFALYGIDASFIWHAFFTNWFGMHYGAGVGIGILGGNIQRTKALDQNCTAQNVGDPNQCTHNGVNSVTGPLADVPPVVPILNAVLGVDFRVPTLRGWEARIEGGFYDAFFLGGGVGYTF
jgi:hypothetical protein